MKEFDIIFLNCGLDDTTATDTTVIENLQSYVATGRKIYGSDWAYNFIEQSHPSLIDFYDGDEVDGLGATAETLDEAKVGSRNSDQAVTIDDSGILTYLRENGIIGESDTTASINFDLGSWVVMTETSNTTTDLLSAATLPSGPSDVTDVPIASLYCDTNSNGGIFYGSYHTEIGEATDEDDVQEAILRYMILNGFNACTN